MNLEELEETRFLIMLRTDFEVEGNKPNSNSTPPKCIWEVIQGLGDSFWVVQRPIIVDHPREYGVPSRDGCVCHCYIHDILVISKTVEEHA